MLLTLKQSAHQGFKSFHDYSPPTPPSSSRFSPAITNAGLPLPHLPSATKSTTQPMSTPHRGLPHPAALTLPQPTQGPPPLGQAPQMGQSMGPLPPPPQQWQGAEEPMRNWLMAKAEEDKRKQEEEKTRQEGLRLEQRKIEQDMLRTSINGGIPPYMIPMVFAGLGGGNLSNASLEAAQHYMAQAQQHQQQLQQQQQQAALPPVHQPLEGRRDSRQFYGGSQQPAPLPSTPIAPGQQQSAGFVPSYTMSPSRSRAQLPGPASLSRLPQASELPRLNTSEMHVQQPPQSTPSVQVLSTQSAHPLQQTQSANPSQQESQSSPSIYFHHWQPPTSQAGSSGANQPSTPSDVHTSSPRKRKAQGPPPTSQPQHNSPPFSHGGSSTTGTPSGRRQGHSRQRSDLSSRGIDSYGRPMSRHRHSESLVSSQSGLSPLQQESFDNAPSGESRGGPRRTSTSDRSDTRQPSQHERQPLPSGPEMKSEERDSAERESSLRASSKRDDSRD